MSNQFLSYEDSLKLKELGFNEECFGWYVSKQHGLEIGLCDPKQLIREAIVAPLWQQAFDFFRLHNFENHIQCEGIYGYYFVINNEKFGNDEENCGFHYEEARLKCLTKLIEISK